MIQAQRQLRALLKIRRPILRLSVTLALLAVFTPIFLAVVVVSNILLDKHEARHNEIKQGTVGTISTVGVGVGGIDGAGTAEADISVLNSDVGFDATYYLKENNLFPVGCELYGVTGFASRGAFNSIFGILDAVQISDQPLASFACGPKKSVYLLSNTRYRVDDCKGPVTPIYLLSLSSKQADNYLVVDVWNPETVSTPYLFKFPLHKPLSLKLGACHYQIAAPRFATDKTTQLSAILRTSGP